MPWGKRLRKRRLVDDISMEHSETEEEPEVVDDTEPEKVDEPEEDKEDEPVVGPHPDRNLSARNQRNVSQAQRKARAEGIEAGYDEAVKIARLCTIAYGEKSGPAIMQYLKAGYSFAEAQEDLEESRAAESDRTEIRSHILPDDGIEKGRQARSAFTTEDINAYFQNNKRR